MDLDLSDDQRDLEESARDVLEREHTVELARRVVEEREGAHKEVDDLWTRIVGLDWPSLTIPEENGGLGLGTVELVVVTEQTGRTLVPGPFLPTASQYVAAVRHGGTPEQRKKYLDPVANGGVAGTLALAEEGGSFDAAGVSTTFRAMRGGYVLDGTKSFVIEPTRSENIVVVARADGSSGSSGIGLFVVPAATPGVEITPISSLDSTRELATVSLSSVKLGPDHALGSPGDARALLDRVLAEATVALAAEIVGTCQGILDILLDHLQTREQFGVKIGSFQAMKHKMANLYVAIESARATARFAAAAITERDERTDLAVSMAKAAAGDCEKLVGVEGIQSLGGIGYTWEHDMHLYVKRIRTAAALFGTASQHRERIAELIGL